jgi:hypothetical protein
MHRACYPARGPLKGEFHLADYYRRRHAILPRSAFNIVGRQTC